MTTDAQPTAKLRLLPDPAAEGAASQDTSAQQEPPTLDQAYRRYAPYVAAIATRILGSEQDLEDLVQDVFVDATRGIAKLREPAAIKGWLARITVRAAMARLRRRRMRQALWLNREPIDYEAVVSPEANGDQRATVVRVYRALETLPAPLRVAWVLRHVQGESLEAAARHCGCSLSTYQRRLRSAAARLKQEMGHG